MRISRGARWNSSQRRVGLLNVLQTALDERCRSSGRVGIIVKDREEFEFGQHPPLCDGHQGNRPSFSAVKSSSADSFMLLAQALAVRERARPATASKDGRGRGAADTPKDLRRFLRM